MTTDTPEKGSRVKVLYVQRKNAKSVKCALEQAGTLNKNFRMTQADANVFGGILRSCIAIPVMESFDGAQEEPWMVHTVEDVGYQLCPYSTSVLGSRRQVSGTSADDLTVVQQAILQTVLVFTSKETDIPYKDEMVERIRILDAVVCPKKLEVFGDDRTLVVPPNAFDGEAFEPILSLCETRDRPSLIQLLWKSLADSHGSSRVVRRGTVDKESKIRQSGHRLVWPVCGVCDETGPGSPGWITVTEQGIKQSFDMTRVMFSRGNISEKIRFGKVVKTGDVVLDMYAGIGYYTLPALIHGHASYVYACEWNEHAANALRYNINDNNVEDRVTVLQGDCRVLTREHGLVDMFDRVSLGLLPSSEGGWSAAVRALKRDTGGWLHVHANVPEKEITTWTLWLCRRLLDIVDDANSPSDWVVLCEHVERVKSFAPTVSHYVADVFVGPAQQLPQKVLPMGSRAGMLESGEFIPCIGEVKTPSCALSPDGVLSQAWMREEVIVD